jgi:hypothetical protein
LPDRTNLTHDPKRAEARSVNPDQAPVSLTGPRWHRGAASWIGHPPVGSLRPACCSIYNARQFRAGSPEAWTPTSLNWSHDPPGKDCRQTRRESLPMRPPVPCDRRQEHDHDDRGNQRLSTLPEHTARTLNVDEVDAGHMPAQWPFDRGVRAEHPATILVSGRGAP